MAVYQQFPRLYDQSGQGTTTSYYGGLNKNPTLSSYAGNQNVGKVGQTPATGTVNTTPTPAPVRRPVYNPTTGQMDLGQGAQRYGAAGEYLEDPQSNISRSQGYDPRYYEQYQTENGTSWRVRQDVRDRLGNRIQVNQPGVVGRNPDGSIMEGQGFNETLDPNAVEWDDEFGWVMNKDNLSGSDPDDKARWDRIRNTAIAATLGGAAWAGGMIPGLSGTEGATTAVAGGGAGAPTAMMEGYLAGGAAPAATTAALGGGASIPTAMMEGYMPGATAATGAATGVSNMSTYGRTALNLAGGAANWYLANRTQDGMSAAADRADPYGQYRERGATNLHALEANPNSVTETPQYQFLQQQGEQGIERTAAKTGYFRSPNMLFDLSKFNQGLAAQEYNKEWERRAAEAGVNINPSTGAQIQANGVTGSNNMRAAAGSQMITQIVNSAPDFYNWLFGA